MRIVNLLLAIMFIVFAFLQVNDPDPVIWILVYGIMAVVCILAAFNIYLRKFMLVVGAVYLLYSIYYFPGVREWLRQDDKSILFDNLAKMQFSYVEESREFLGLLICVIVLAFYLIRSRRYS